MKITGSAKIFLLLLLLAVSLYFYYQPGKKETSPAPLRGIPETKKGVDNDTAKKTIPKTQKKENETSESRKHEKRSSPWIKILNYHEIFPEAYFNSKDPKINRFSRPSDLLLIVTAENFEKQMEFLADNYKVVHFSDFAEHLEKKQAYDQNVVIITFDGADETIYKFAYPVLKKYKLPATLFLHINSLKFDKTAMKWDTIKLLHEEGLIEIESHSISHPHMNRMLAGETQEAYEARIRKELVESKKIIEEKLDKKVLYFAYPYGGYNETVIKLLKESGYKASVTVQWDKNTVFSNPYALKRRGVFNNYTLKKFKELFTANIKDDPREYAD